MNISQATYTGYTIGFPQSPSVGINSGKDTPESQIRQTAAPEASKAPQTQAGVVRESPPNQGDTNAGSDNNSAYTGETQQINGKEFDQNDLRLIDSLKQRDTEVRRHEMAHVAAGGSYITSAANFTYKKGPDGKNYAVGGEVGIDTSPVPGDPEATLRKMKQIKNAALAPADPSPQDLKVAAKATSSASKALSELMMQQVKEQMGTDEEKAYGGSQNAADSYEKINGLPETDTHSFEIAV